MRGHPVVAILTAGGLAPCLSSSIAALIEGYRVAAPHARIIGYRDGYRGLLLNESLDLGAIPADQLSILHEYGGSPLGNSRIKLANNRDNVRHGWFREGDDGREVAAARLRQDGVDILHVVGGDDTNLAAADLAQFLAQSSHPLTVVGLPKTVDNDISPIRQSLGAATAAEQGARFFRNVVAEHGANPRMLLVHEVMGRDCGWLAARTAYEYLQDLGSRRFAPAAGLTRERHMIHGVYLPEMPLDIGAEAMRLRDVMDRHDCVNLFVSEGAGVGDIVREMHARGDVVPVDAFGHVRLAAVNPGAWFASQFAAMIGADKTLVQKSGYFARSGPANSFDRALIRRCAEAAVDAALAGTSGVVGEDEAGDDAIRCIPFDRISGGKRFDPRADWFTGVLQTIGQAA